MKKIFILLVFLCSVPAFAGIVPPEIAALVAKNFYAERANLRDLQSYQDLRAELAETVTWNESLPVYYVYSINRGGFVLVSATDLCIPVLGFSFEGSFDKNLSNVASWMTFYENQIRYQLENESSSITDISGEWDRLRVTDPLLLNDFNGITSVAPLLVSKWNQDKYYNGHCPEDPSGPDGRCYAGCVATAMGQLMYYYRFPEQGTGSYSYTLPEYGTLSADFGNTTYDWNGMPSELNAPSDAIAELLYHLGVSVDMDYGPDGSGMWNHKAAYSLKTYFRYGPETQYYFRDSTNLAWDSILVANLDQRKPLYYAGWAGVQSNSGHAFVCDGYQPGGYYHFNWGWGGQSDGYFMINNLTPGGNNFNFAQEVIPLFPDTLLNVYPAYCNGQAEIHTIRGSVEDGSGWKKYLPSQSCSWLIKPMDPEYDSISQIRLKFLRMETEAGLDQLFIYDGDSSDCPLIGAYSGTELPPVITSTGDKLYLVFQTNGSSESGGWQADFEPVFPVYCSGTTVINDWSGTIEDGSGDKNYIANTLCKWKIMPDSAGAVTLTFTDFHLPDSSDILRIFDLATNKLLASLTGTGLPDPVTSASGRMLLMFYTNKSINGDGWSGYFAGSLVSVDEIPGGIAAVSVSPNPASGYLKIQYPMEQNRELQFEIISLQGSIVLSDFSLMGRESDTKLIDVSGIMPGVYFLRIRDSLSSKVMKIIIK